MSNLIVEAVKPSGGDINTITRSIGGAIGATVATTILTSTPVGHTPIRTESAYTTAFLVIGDGSILGILAALGVPRGPQRVMRQVRDAAGSAETN